MDNSAIVGKIDPETGMPIQAASPLDSPTIQDLITMYGGSGSNKGMTSNQIWSGDGDASNYSGQLMDIAKKYDPNAKLGDAGDLQFDRSKLPQSSLLGTLASYDQGGGKGGNFWDQYSKAYKSGDGGYRGPGGAEMLDPTKVLHDPVYGDFIHKSNLKQAPGDQSSGLFAQTEKYMPSIISAIMAAGMGVAAGPMIGGLMSSAIGPGGIGDKLSMGEKVNWGNVAKNAGMSMAGGALGGSFGDLGGALGGGLGEAGGALQQIMPWLNKAKQAYSLYQMYHQGRG